MTVTQILSTVDERPLPSLLEFHFKDGCDGSGSHSIYDQKGNKDTHNILLYMFTPLRLYDPIEDEDLWKEENPSSPHSARPLMLFLGKETYENMKIAMEIQKEKETISKEIANKDRRPICRH